MPGSRDGKKAQWPGSPVIPTRSGPLPVMPDTITGQVRPGLETDQARLGLRRKPAGSLMGLVYKYIQFQLL